MTRHGNQFDVSVDLEVIEVFVGALRTYLIGSGSGTNGGASDAGISVVRSPKIMEIFDRRIIEA